LAMYKLILLVCVALLVVTPMCTWLGDECSLDRDCDDGNECTNDVCKVRDLAAAPTPTTLVPTKRTSGIAHTAKSTMVVRAMPLENLGCVRPESVNQAGKHPNRSLTEGWATWGCLRCSRSG
jgi:hypothetical protein